MESSKALSDDGAAVGVAVGVVVVVGVGVVVVVDVPVIFTKVSAM